MSTAEAPSRSPGSALFGLFTPHATEPAEPLTLDPRLPLVVHHCARWLTLAVVSIEWLAARQSAERERLEAACLTLDEGRCAASMHPHHRRCEWLAGRLALKHAVCAHQLRRWGSADRLRDLRVTTVAHGMRAGKPVVDVPVEVGLSHSMGLAVAACGPHALGIDLEYRREVPPLLAALLDAEAESWAAEPGRRRLAAMPLPLRWACKEAVLKHYGFGLRVDPRHVALTGWHPDGRFTWRARSQLLRYAPAAGDGLQESWAYEIDGYFLALVRT